MLDPLIRKLENFAKLSDEDKQTLRDAVQDIREIRPRQDIIREGEAPEHIHLILEGWAVRYKSLAEGERPIMAYLIPGDLCDVQITLLHQMDHSIGTLSRCRVAYLRRDAMEDIMERNRLLARALWWSTLVDEAILREWLVTLGHRPADKRIAHLLCEMLLRSKAVGLTDDDSFDLPPTQEELGDTMGMTAIHMNRMLQDLRRQGLIHTEGKRVVVENLDRLMTFAGFNPNYLHHERQDRA